MGFSEYYCYIDKGLPQHPFQNLLRHFISKQKRVMLKTWGRMDKMLWQHSSFLMNTWLSPTYSSTHLAKLWEGRGTGRRTGLRSRDEAAIPLHGQGLVSSASHWFMTIFPHLKKYRWIRLGRAGSTTGSQQGLPFIHPALCPWRQWISSTMVAFTAGNIFL